jgi:hypothetical protein
LNLFFYVWCDPILTVSLNKHLSSHKELGSFPTSPGLGDTKLGILFLLSLSPPELGFELRHSTTWVTPLAFLLIVCFLDRVLQFYPAGLGPWSFLSLSHEHLGSEESTPIPGPRNDLFHEALNLVMELYWSSNQTNEH